MKVPFFRSIRLRILLLVIVPVLFSAVSIAILSNISIRTARSMQETVNRQSSVYQQLALPDALLSRLGEYLGAGEEERRAEFLAVWEELYAFADQLGDLYPDQPYAQSWAGMCQHFLLAAENAAALADDSQELLAAYQEVAGIQSLLNRLSPYVTREIEDASLLRVESTVRQVNSAVWNDGIILALILLLLIVAAALIARSLIQPLLQLINAVSALTISIDHTNLARTKRQDELGILIRSYRDMVKRIRAQMTELQDKQNIERMLQMEKEKNLEAENQLVRSELKVYQSQINSHFLFNAFNTVSRLAYMENAPQVQHAVSLIAQFLRNILTQFDRLVTVEEEFSIVRNFIDIQNLRFGDRIKVECELDPGAEWCQVPALTLQPLVENAYRHGLADRKEGYIRCVAEMEENCLRLYAWDDGAGISPQRQQAIRDYVSAGHDDAPGQESVGLRNVFRRLALMYPGRVELLLDSCEGAYTQIGFSVQIDAESADSTMN